MIARSAVALFAATALVGAVPAQQPRVGGPPAVDRRLPPGPGPSLLATDRYLFVLRGDQLLQYDVDTLRLLRSVRLPGREAGEPEAGAGAPAVLIEEPFAGRAQLNEAPNEEPADAPPAVDAGRVRSAVADSILWLRAHQDADGHWDADGFMKHDPAPDEVGAGNPVQDVGVTGLALLALLADPTAAQPGPVQDAAVRAVGWLAGQQQENGIFGTNATADFIYGHAIATGAICEAVRVLQLDARRRLVAQTGLDYLEQHRNPYAVWRYQPRDNDNDTSVTAWAALAYLAGADAGLQVNKNALKLVATWLDQVTDRDGRSGYTKAGEWSSRRPGDHMQRFPPMQGEALTAAAVYLRLRLGQDPESSAILPKSIALLAEKPPRWEPKRGAVDPYYWFFGTRALRQVGGEAWQRWSGALATALLDAQRHDGTMSGSWDPVGVWDVDGGRVYATAMYALALEAVRRGEAQMR